MGTAPHAQMTHMHLYIPHTESVCQCRSMYRREREDSCPCVVYLRLWLCSRPTSRRQEAITPSPPSLSSPSKGDQYWNDGPPMSSPSIRWAIECMLMLWIIERTVTIDWLRIIGGLHRRVEKDKAGEWPARGEGHFKILQKRFKYLLRLLTQKGARSEVAWRARLTIWCFQPPFLPHPPNTEHGPCSAASVVLFFYSHILWIYLAAGAQFSWFPVAIVAHCCL